MKKLIIFLCILCCISNARVLSYSTTINKVRCTIRVNPEKGRVEVGKCGLLSIGFYDKDNLLVTAFTDELDAKHDYAKLDFFEDLNDAKDVVKIVADFDEPEMPEDPHIERKARKNHYHRTADGLGWECDEGYIWGDDGDHCIKDDGTNNNCPPSWQNADGTCKKGW